VCIRVNGRNGRNLGGSEEYIVEARGKVGEVVVTALPRSISPSLCQRHKHD